MESHVACHSIEIEHDFRQGSELCAGRTSSSFMRSLHTYVGSKSDKNGTITTASK